MNNRNFLKLNVSIVSVMNALKNYLKINNIIYVQFVDKKIGLKYNDMQLININLVIKFFYINLKLKNYKNLILTNYISI